MKTSSPYGMSIPVKDPVQAVHHGQAMGNGKAKARYPHTPLGPSQKNSEAGKMKRPAFTPGGTPAGA